jgi:hypothetical protein
MGLSIHYSGRFKNAELLPDLIEEIKDIATVYDWKYYIYETNFSNNAFENNVSFDNIYGISFTPTNCETLSLAFLSNGVLVCPFRIPIFADSENEVERSYIYTNSVKTQFAGMFIHQLLIRLFKYLNNKYFENFKLSDESYYWETDDENLMRKQFNLYNHLLDSMEISIQTFPIQSDENIVAYFERLMKYIDGKKRGFS